jgi:Flp pilus assembly pilin Flp
MPIFAICIFIAVAIIAILAVGHRLKTVESKLDALFTAAKTTVEADLKKVL